MKNYDFAYFEKGLENPYQFMLDEDARNGAGSALGVFTQVSSSVLERQIALYEGGKYTGSVLDPSIREIFTGFYKKCAETPEGESIELNANTIMEVLKTTSICDTDFATDK